MTVVSNIHLNIAGWSNATYAAGARVSNSGNAYQCTTAGTSTAPPTGTGIGINNGGTSVWKYLSGIDYTTLQAWANDTTRFPAVLTQPILANPWNSGGPVVATLGTPILTLSGHTTSSSNTITIRPAAGESFQAAFQAAPITPYAYNPASGVVFQMPPAISIVTAGSGGSFTDASGNVWTINAANNGEVYENGSPPNGQFSNNVTQIALVGGVIWLENTSIQWFSWSGTAWVNGINPIPTVPTATVVAGSGGSFTDGSSNVWTINAANNGEPYENGSPPAFSSNVVQIALVGGVVWQVNSSNQWYSWSGTAWVGGTPQYIAVNYFQINDNFVILDGLQFQSPIANFGGSIIGGSGTNLSIQQSIIDGYAQSVGAPPIAISGANFSLTNSLVVGRNTTAGGGMISTLGAAGAAVANNTFVHTSLVTGQRVLDSGSNVTTSTETSTNNIFYNYDIVYACVSSGTPWLSSHCFYSAASFSASNNGTDAGGSVYALTAAAIFAGFPTNMNPVSGSAVINAGLTDTTDIPTSIDAFGTSRPQGSNWDGGAVELLITAMSVTRDFPASFDFKQALSVTPNPVFAIEWRQSLTVDRIVPVEWASVLTSINTNAQMPLEILQSAPSLADPWGSDFSTDFGPPGATYSTDPSFAIEWRASVALLTTRDAAVGVEWGAAKQRDFGVSIEWRQALAVDALAPAEWGHTTFSINADARMPLEILQGVPVLDKLVPVEWGASVTLLTARDVAIGVEWLGQASFGANVPMPLEILQGTAWTPTFPTEWGATLAPNLFVPAEINAGVQATEVAPLASVATLLRDVAASTEWGVSATFGINATFVIEWKRSLTADSIAPISWLGTQFGPVNIAVGLEWRAGLTADSPGVGEWRASLQADSAAPVEWIRSIATETVSVPIEYGQGVVADNSASIAAFAKIQSDTSDPLTWSSTLTLPISFAIPVDFAASVLAGSANAIDWSAPLIVTSTMPLDTGAALTADSRSSGEILRGVQATTVVPVEPGAGVGGAGAAPLEFGHLTVTTIVNATMPLEITRLVVGDVVVPIEPRKVRLTIGSRLEPDAWERQATTEMP